MKQQQCASFHRDRALARIAAIEAENGWCAGSNLNVVIQQQQQSSSNSVNVMVNVVTSGGGVSGGQGTSPASVAPVVYTSSIPAGDAQLSPIAPA